MVHYSRFTKRVLAGTHENNDAEKTSFVTNVGLHQFRVMPFSLCNATGTFQRLIECVLSDIHFEIRLYYIHDFKEHTADVTGILYRI